MISKLYFFLFVAILSFSEVFAQSPDIDSLRNTLSFLKGEDRLAVLNDLSFYLREVEQQNALLYAMEAELLAQSLGDKASEAKAKENIGWIYYRKGQWQKTFKYSNDAYDLAIESNALSEAARVLNSMGALYYEKQNYEMAITQFEKAYQISEQVGDSYTTMRSLNNVGLNYTLLHEFDSALKYVQLAVAANEGAKSSYLLAFSYRVIGDIYLGRDVLDSAEIAFEKAMEVSDGQDFTMVQATILHRLGRIYLLNGKLELGKDALERGIKLSKENEFLDELAKCHRYLADYYKIKGDINAAYNQQLLFLKFNDSVISKLAHDRINLLKGMFQEDFDQSELNLLLAKNEYQASRLALDRKIIVIVGIGVLLILILLVRLFVLNRNIKKSNLNLIHQKQQIHKQNEELEAKSIQLQDINQTKNKLFSILGHDLRGPVGQVKSVVDLLTSGQLDQQEFDELILALKKDVDSVFLTLNNTLKWSVAQMEGFRLQKVNFNLLDLVNSAIQLIEPKLKEKSLHVENSFLSHDIEVYADRDLIEVIIRNILNNAVKFSKPGGLIHISTEIDNDLIIWSVKDQGIGMRQDQINELLSPDYAITNSTLGTKMERGSGLGLQICKEFIGMNGGKLSIKSKLGKGTTVSVHIPKCILLESN